MFVLIIKIKLFKYYINIKTIFFKNKNIFRKKGRLEMRKLRGPKGNMDKCRDRTAKSLGKSHRRYAEAVLLNSLHKTPHVSRQYYTPAHLPPPRLPQNYRGIFVKKNRNYNTHPFSYHFPLTTSPSLSLSLPLMLIILLLLILR